MLKAITLLIVLCFPHHTLYAKTLANCTSPSGHTFYPFIGMATKKDSGWSKDKISGMRATLSLENSEFDILYVDASGTVTSSVNSGASISPVLIGIDSYFTIMSTWSVDSVELYSFWKSKDNKYKFSLTQVKGGILPKSSVLVGDCSFIDFSWLE